MLFKREKDLKPEKNRSKFSDFYHYAYIEFLDDLAPQLVVWYYSGRANFDNP